MDKEAWRATAHRVSQSRTQLKRLSKHAHTVTWLASFLGQTGKTVWAGIVHLSLPPLTRTPLKDTSRYGLVISSTHFLEPQLPLLTPESLSLCTRPLQLTNQEWAEPPPRANQIRNTAGQLD